MAISGDLEPPIFKNFIDHPARGQPIYSYNTLYGGQRLLHECVVRYVVLPFLSHDLPVFNTHNFIQMISRIM